MNNDNRFIFKTALTNVEAKSPEFILEDFLPLAKRKVTMLSAKGGSGKSFIAIQAGIRFSNQDKKVGMWLSEDEMGEIRERANLINERILFSKVQISEHLYINGSEQCPPQITVEDIEEIKYGWKGLDLVIIDPLIGFFGGNENDNSQAKQFMSILTSIATQNNQAILVLHHNTKQDQDGNSTTRGASAFVDAVRTLYSLRYDKEEHKHFIKVEKDNLNVKKFLGDEFEIKAIPFEIIYEENIKEEKEETVYNNNTDWF
jgi:replicative DNA helicase